MVCEKELCACKEHTEENTNKVLQELPIKQSFKEILEEAGITKLW